MIRLGVTGTDTGVGKTVVTCAIAAALRARAAERVEQPGTGDGPFEGALVPGEPPGIAR